MEKNLKGRTKGYFDSSLEKPERDDPYNYFVPQSRNVYVVTLSHNDLLNNLLP